MTEAIFFFLSAPHTPILCHIQQWTAPISYCETIIMTKTRQGTNIVFYGPSPPGPDHK